MVQDKLQTHLDLINRFYDRVMADESLTRQEAEDVYRAVGVVQSNLNAVDAPLRPALADVVALCKAKLRRRLVTQERGPQWTEE
jgi:hypothetical protein